MSSFHVVLGSQYLYYDTFFGGGSRQSSCFSKHRKVEKTFNLRHQQALSRDGNPFMRLSEMGFSSYRGRVLITPHFEPFHSAFGNKVGKHLRPTYQKQSHQGKTPQVPPWCREAHQRSRDGTVRPIRDGLNRTLT
jgi:hypothetical protein